MSEMSEMNDIYLSEAFDKYVNPIFFNMYVVAVQTGRFTIEMLPPIYKERVAKLLGTYSVEEIKTQ